MLSVVQIMEKDFEMIYDNRIDTNVIYNYHIYFSLHPIPPLLIQLNRRIIKSIKFLLKKDRNCRARSYVNNM